ncbi:LysE family translocator [Chitinophaga filiformis]|uniref:LysE family transporter n=1 Tax=Chitinophaga filiformis TaxID=104663 RepID=UPI001F401485|nr:LysE family transporter [Chitinophaga filiformis]MCF6401782.1 LysE family translocator [Chitinophaga filiformis]
MKQHSRMIGWAMGISFTGSLPLGTLNLTVANFSFAGNLAGAAMFGVAAIIIEMLLVRIALLAVKQLEKLKRILWFFHLITGAVLLLLAFNSLTAAWQKQMFQAETPFTTLHPFIMGVLLSIINPLHIPFWIGWTAVLKAKHLLSDNRVAHNFYVMAIGMGTALAFSAYALAGRLLIDYLVEQHVLLNWILGIVLLITGMAQLYKAFIVQPVAMIRQVGGRNE